MKFFSWLKKHRYASITVLLISTWIPSYYIISSNPYAKVHHVEDDYTKMCQAKWPQSVAVQNGTHWYCHPVLGEAK